ncbi:MAG: flagellar hook assembly protein FlgD [Proteobacteria bacterium]|nr:flagellar hook assembly protein FlgD [Pseudomonadota bacterium]
MTISATSNSASTNSASTNSLLSGTSAQDIQNQFITLLVSQLQNQDPLNPMNNSQITSQLAQISTVSGIQSLDSSVSGLISTMNANQSLQATGLIGKTVLVPNNQIALLNGQASGAVNLSSATNQLVVNITDASGNVIQSINLGGQAAGTVPFSWNGTRASGQTLPDGLYSVTASVLQNGKQTTVPVLASGTIGSVSINNGTLGINVNGLGSFSASNIQQIM